MTSAFLYAALIPGCAAVGALGLAAWRFARLRPVVLALTAALAAASVLAFTLRTLEAEHLPLFGTYESALSLAMTVLVSALILDLAGRHRSDVLPPALLVAAALLAHGFGYDQRVWALTISERSIWVDVHAFFAWLAFGVLTANAALALRILVSGAAPRRDRWLASTLTLGFLLHSGMMASGSFYKFLLFGKAWSHDPIELLGFIAWIAYGTLLHLHLFARWEGRRLAKWSLALFVILVVSYRDIVYFPSWASYHILDIDLRLHLPRS